VQAQAQDQYQNQEQGQDTIVVRVTTPRSLQTTEESDLPRRSQLALSPSPPLRQPVPELPYYAPEAIYRRYVAARAAWYESQPAGCLKTNQEYRRAIGLPQRYGREMHTWCQDHKQMGQYCHLPQGGRRKWTKEEMIAYLMSA
jgi:hypothetical protein